MSWALVKDGKLVKFINRPVAITIDGVQHPETIFRLWAKDELKDVGIYEHKKVVPSYNRKFYTESDPKITISNVKGIVTSKSTVSAKDLEPMKSSKLAEIKNTAFSLLQPTDWHVIKMYETGEDIPTNIVEFREAVRAKSNELETLINSCETMEDFEALHNSSVDEETQETIPAALTSWPTLEE